MKSLAIDDNGDLIFNGTDLEVVDGLEQLAQEAEMSVGVAKGEWFLDEDAGTSYDALYNRPFNESEFRNDVIEGLSGTTQELSLLSATFSKPTTDRKTRLDISLKTTDGEILNISDLEVG